MINLVQGYSEKQRKVLAEFFTTIAAGWFGAGIIATVFTHPIELLNVTLNISLGLIFSYVSLWMAMYLVQKK